MDDAEEKKQRERAGLIRLGQRLAKEMRKDLARKEARERRAEAWRIEMDRRRRSAR